ncbi:MAG: hypothetical protein WAU70_01320 [Flavobacteriales bacterium]
MVLGWAMDAIGVDVKEEKQDAAQMPQAGTHRSFSGPACSMLGVVVLT